jgi:hypothetical protein
MNVTGMSTTRAVLGYRGGKLMQKLSKYHAMRAV